ELPDLNVCNQGDAAPAAADDSVAVAQGSTLTASAPGVLANDSDAEGDALTASVVSGPSHGTLALAADGSFTSTPSPGYSGPDSFIYGAEDGALSSNATVSITVANLPPAAAGDSYSVQGRGTLA